MPIAGVCPALCRLPSAIGGWWGGQAFATAVGAPVVPGHVLQVLLPRAVSARSRGRVSCGFGNWDLRSGMAQSSAGSPRRALAGEKALREGLALGRTPASAGDPARRMGR